MASGNMLLIIHKTGHLESSNAVCIAISALWQQAVRGLPKQNQTPLLKPERLVSSGTRLLPSWEVVFQLYLTLTLNKLQQAQNILSTWHSLYAKP